MRKALVFCSALLVVVAPAVLAEGLDLTWRACNADPGRTSAAVLDCAAPGGSTIDLFGCFQIAATQDSFIGMDCVLNLGVEDPNGPPLEDFWHFDGGACNDLANGSAVLSIARPETLCSGAASPWNSQTQSAMAYRIDSPCRGHFYLSIDRETPLKLLANTNFLAFRITFSTDRAVENGTGQCTGCSYPGVLIWTSATLGNIRGGGQAYLVSGPGLVSNCPTFNNSSYSWCSTDCFDCPLVPVRNRTWGQLKSLYR